jgi:hypothetical protein
VLALSDSSHIHTCVGKGRRGREGGGREGEKVAVKDSTHFYIRQQKPGISIVYYKYNIPP